MGCICDWNSAKFSKFRHCCDLSYNYLNGSIPVEWASMQLKYIGLLANRLSGEIPKELGNFTSLTYLDLEANQFSGAVSSDLGKLVNLEKFCKYNTSGEL